MSAKGLTPTQVAMLTFLVETGPAYYQDIAAHLGWDMKGGRPRDVQGMARITLGYLVRQTRVGIITETIARDGISGRWWRATDEGRAKLEAHYDQANR